jgi:hypothetical protein
MESDNRWMVMTWRGESAGRTHQDASRSSYLTFLSFTYLSFKICVSCRSLCVLESVLYKESEVVLGERKATFC